MTQNRTVPLADWYRERTEFHRKWHGDDSEHTKRAQDTEHLIRQLTEALEETTFNLEAAAAVIHKRDAKALKSVIRKGKDALQLAYQGSQTS